MSTATQPSNQPSNKPTTTTTTTDPDPDPDPESSLTVRFLADTVLDELGHDPRSAYVEQFWVAVLGPSGVLLLRRMAMHFDAFPEGFEMELQLWARELGLGSRGGKHSPLMRTIDRLCRFGLASRNGRNLAVRRKLAPLTRRQLRRLPPHLQATHRRWENKDRPANRAA